MNGPRRRARHTAVAGVAAAVGVATVALALRGAAPPQEHARRVPPGLRAVADRAPIQFVALAPGTSRGQLGATATPPTAARDWVIEAPRGVLAALARWDASFRPWRATEYHEHVRSLDSLFTEDAVPWAVRADLTGDGQVDLVLAGRTQRGPALVAVVADTTATHGYRVVAGDARLYEAGRGEDRVPLRPLLLVLGPVPRGQYEGCTDVVSLPQGGFTFQPPGYGLWRVLHVGQTAIEERYTGC